MVMSNNTATMTIVQSSQQTNPGSAFMPSPAAAEATREPLLRDALGETLRDLRTRCGFTLRELSERAAISPGYLSELERGRKEVSSELLAAIGAALGVSVSDLMMEAASAMALHSASPELAAM